MRLKGISWIEQHFEKVFAGVFGAAALGVLTLQFAGGSNTVKVGPKDGVPIEDAYDEVARAAARTKEEVQNLNVEVPKLPDGANPIAMFEKSFRGPIAPQAQLAHALGSPAGLSGSAMSDIGGRAGAALAKLTIPAPVAASKPHAGMYTVHPMWHEVPEVAAVLPAAKPYDMSAVTVEMTFDPKPLKAALEADPDGAAGPLAPMRREWWENMQILGFAIEREELLPDGQWGKLVSVPAMPGRDLPLARLDKIVDAETLNEARLESTERATEVRRPEFYDLWAGPEWMAPAEHAAAAEAGKVGGDGRAAKLAQKKQLERQLDNLQRRRAEMGPLAGAPDAGAPPAGNPRGGGRQPGGGGRRPGGAGGGQRGGGRQPGGASGRTYTDDQRRSMDRNIENVEKQLAQINSDLGIAKPDAADGAAPAAAARALELSIFDQPEIQLWAHDVSVERGKTYRYRGTVVFNNPLFGKGAVMTSEQADWARPTLARSEPSAWTDPVETPAESYWFVTGANEPGGPFGRTADARAEVFVFTLGYWRQGGVSLEPGDRIATDIAVPDAEKLAAMAPPADAPDQPRPGDRGVPPPPGGGGKRGAGPATPAQAPPTGGQQRAEGEQAERVPPIMRPYVADAVLLGVGSVVLNSEAAGGGRATQAYLRLGNGAIRVVRPDLERTSPVYRDVRASAENARAEELRLRDPERDAPANPNPGRDIPPPPPPPGGGGDGGGGGGG